MKYLMPLLFTLFLSTLVSCEQQEGTKVGDLTNSAKIFVEMMVKENYAGAVEKFDRTMKDAMPIDKLQEAWQGLLAKAGIFKKQIGLRQTKEQGYDIVYVTCEFEKEKVDIKVVFNNAKQVSGLWFIPSQ